MRSHSLGRFHRRLFRLSECLAWGRINEDFFDLFCVFFSRPMVFLWCFYGFLGFSGDVLMFGLTSRPFFRGSFEGNCARSRLLAVGVFFLLDSF